MNGLSAYNPIACTLHEHYQLAVIKQARLILLWRDEDGVERRERICPIDVYTRSKAEYLLAATENSAELEIRLDWIREARWAIDGKLLGV